MIGAGLFLILSLSFAHAAPDEISIREEWCQSRLLGRARSASYFGEEPLRFELPRLVLRPGRESDYQDVENVIRDPIDGDVLRYYFNMRFGHSDLPMYMFDDVLSLPSTRRFSPTEGYSRDFHFVAETTDAAKKVIGFGVIRQSEDLRLWTIGYAVGRSHRRIGYAREMVEGLLKFIYELNPQAIVQARIMESNIASQTLAQSLGFKFVNVSSRKILRENVLYYEHTLKRP